MTGYKERTRLGGNCVALLRSLVDADANIYWVGLLIAIAHHLMAAWARGEAT